MDSPPDEVTFGPWEADPESEYEEVRFVPVSGSLLKGFTYKEFRTQTFRRLRRARYEKWHYPQVRIPRVIEGVGMLDLTIVAVEVPAYTMGRWTYEYRSVQ